MDATHIIRDAVMHVAQLRHTAANTPGLALAVRQIKELQARRFAGTYADLFQSEPYRLAGQFFLEELYSAKDYTGRDAQFARIAGALERIFPKQVVKTAVLLAQLHHLSETLDMAMAQHWLRHAGMPDSARYVTAWRDVGRSPDRDLQLASVVNLGRELDRLTRTPGLRLMLKMMRGPANLAGLGALQKFLESGFDTFVAMGKQGKGASYFLETLQTREAKLMVLLFDADARVSETEINLLLGQVR